MTNITRTLSRYVCNSQIDALPPAIRHEGVRAFVNWIGCAAAGSREAIIDRALAVLSEFNGAQEATVVGRRGKLDALNAALVNSMSSSALTFNDTHFVTVAHPTSPVAAALLALAERRRVTGTEFVHALVLGDEVQCRIGNILCVPPAECQVGLSMAGLVGGIGAAVAVGKVLGLDEPTMAIAIGLAANQACGLREAHGTMGSYFTPGHAARCGMFAALLAERGFVCSDTMIEGPKGFAASFGQRPNLEAAVAKLGETFEIAALAYKPYPSGFVIHPITDACLEIANAHAFDPAHIERIEMSVNPLAVQLTNRPEPKTRNQALVSLQHWTAVSLIYKAAGIAQLEESVLHDRGVADLRRKIVATTDASVGRESASVRVTLKGGRTLEARVQHCRGSIGRPMTDDDITLKTRGQLRIAYADGNAEQILAESWRIASYPRVDALCKLLAAVK